MPLLPAGIAVRHCRGAPEPATISTSAAVQVMDRRTHEGVTTGQVTPAAAHRPVDGDPLHLGVWRQIVAEHNMKIDAARGDRNASRRLLHEVTRWAASARDHDAARRTLVRAGLRAEDLLYWPGMNVMVLPPQE